MGIVAALLHNPLRIHRLRSALRGRHTVEGCADWGSLTLLCDSQPVQMAVVDSYVSDDASLEPLRQLRRRFPTIAIVAYVRPPGNRLRDLFDIGRLGIDALVLADHDDEPGAFGATLERAEARGVLGKLRPYLESLPTTVRDAVLLVVTRAHERMTGDSLAATLLITRRVLARHLAAARLPSPQRLITWGRLIVAAHLLEDHDRSADRIAKALHFPSGSAFRNMCQRYVQATPSEIRANGGATWVIESMFGRDHSADDSDDAALEGDAAMGGTA